jgi:hypothetical protein
MIRKNCMISLHYSRQGNLVATSSYSRKHLLGGGLSIFGCCMISVHIYCIICQKKKCNLETALVVAFNFVHAKNCIIRRSDGCLFA